MSRLRRGLLIGGVGLVVLVVGGLVAARLALNSAYARNLVAQKLTAAVGLPVEVSSLSVGRTSSTVGFRAGELLTVESATVDVPLTTLARGDVAAGAVTLSGVRVELRVDKDGKFLTPLPKASETGGETNVPPVHVENATVVIAQEGRPPFTLTNVTADLTPDGDALKLTGQSADPNWGAWAAAGTIDLATSTVRVELTNPAAPLKLDLLRSVPFVPPETWEQVHPAGESAATVVLTNTTDDFTYAVTLLPNKAGLGLPGLGVAVGDVAGAIRIGGPVVTLDGVTGSLADGTLDVSGKLDFGPDPSDLAFQVKAQGVDVKKLPAEWNVPKQFGGKLRGQADLTVLVHPGGRVETRGDGRGDLEGATLAGLPAEIKLRLRSDGKRFRFEEMPGETSHRPRGSAEPPPLAARGRRVAATAPGANPNGVSEGSQGWRALPQPLAPATLAALLLLQPPPSQPAPAAPTTFGASVTLRDVDLAELLKRLEVKLDYQLNGKVTAVVKVAVPVSGDAPEKTTTVRGTVTSKRLEFEGLAANDVSAELVYTDGVLTLSALKAAFDPDAAGGPPGRLAGTATAAVNPRGDLTAKLTLDRVPLGQILKAVPGGPIPVTGPVSGGAEFRAPLDKLADAGTWQATGELTAPTLVAAARTITGVKVPLKVAGGKATLAGGVATVEGIPLTADAGVTLTGAYPYTAAVRSDPQQVAALSRLVPELTVANTIQGKLAATANATGTLSPTTVKAAGTVTATALKIGSSTADAVSAKWALTPDRVTVSDLDADAFKGKITGSADVPFAADGAGKFQVDFTDVDAAGIAAVVPDVPVRLTGKLSGAVTGTLPPGTPRTATAAVNLTAPRLTVQGIPAERLVGSVKVAKGGLDYKLTGKTLGGDFELEGRYPQPPAGDGKPADAGKLSLRGADLRRLGETVRGAAPLAGRVDLEATFAGDLSSGAGQFSLRDVSWGGQEVAPEVRGRLAIRGGQLELADLSGRVAGGSLRGRGRLSMAQPSRNFFTLTLDAADGRRLTAPFAGDGVLDGDTSVVVRLRVFPEVWGTADVSVARGSLAGLDVTGLRLPVEFDLAGGGRVGTRAGAATVADGRADVDLSYDLAAGGRLAGQVRFRDVRVSRLGGPQSVFGNGRATGRFDVSGENVRSANDLTGRLTANLRQTDVRGIPVLAAAAPFLNPRALARPFDTGDVRGRLRNGVFELERLALSSDSADLFADGTVTLQKRLDLRVVARTGNLAGGAGTLRALGLRLPAIGPIPVGLILDISEFLSNRTVRLNVTGTTDQPVVRVNTQALLAEEAVRFFLNRYLPGAAAARDLVPDRR